MDKVITSPDKQHKLELCLVDYYSPEYVPVRADNFIPYYKLKIDDILIKRRYFKDIYLVTENVEFFVIAEWYLQVYSLAALKTALTGPNNRLVIFDFHKKTCGVLSVNIGGDITPKAFEDDKIIYTKNNKGLIRELEVDVSQVKWVPW